MARRFFIVYVLTALLLTAGVIAVNYTVDPYGMNGRVALFSRKPEAATHRRIGLAFEILRTRPREIILGTSRAEYALTTDHPGWKAPREKRLNAAIAGATFYESSRFFSQAIVAGNLERAVVGLDFFAFNAYQRTSKGLNEAVFLSADTPWNRLTQALPFYLSADTLRSSLTTVRYVGPAAAVTSVAEPQEEFAFDTALHGKGQRALFMNSEKYFLSYAFFPHPYRKFALRTAGMPSQLDDFSQMLAEARVHHVDVRLFFSPVHARQLETIYAAGLWDAFETWKREIMAAVGPEDTLWDFTGFGSVQSEPVPAAGDTATHMRGYRESSHYSRHTGALVLTKVLGDGAGVPADFGVRLTPGNIEAHLARLRNERVAWEQAHPADVAEIEALARESQASR